MIYLIITTSIYNKYGLQENREENRKKRYIEAITESLKHFPVRTIIVENNGKRETFLDTFVSNKVSVLYTNNNIHDFKNKGINEMLDIKEVIRYYDIDDNDIIIKLTGRYKVISPLFLNKIIEDEQNYDAFVKFFGVSTLKYEKYDCILGYYAMRAKYLKLFNYLSIANYQSAEIAFAKYIRLCGCRLKEIEKLDLECLFSDNLKLLIV